MGRAQRRPWDHRRAVPDPRRARQDLSALSALEGARPSPNIWHHPATYEAENLAFDRDGLVLARMAAIASWRDRDLLDIGCGTGFHLPAFATTARSVVGVEPHEGLRRLAVRRVRRLATVEVRAGLADALPLDAASVDIAHARWAYFFGPGSEPGLAELDRVVRPGGAGFVIDNDVERSTFGAWFRAGFPEVDPVAVARFWAGNGWERERITTSWRFETREDLEAVVRIELPPRVAEDALASHEGTSLDYAVNLWWRRF